MKTLSSRVITRHATPEEWLRSKLIILKGEQIVYDPGFDPVDGKEYDYSRIKVGDGSKTAKELKFVSSDSTSVTVSKDTLVTVTNVTMPTLTTATYVAPSMSQHVDNDILTIQFDAGSFTPPTLTEGSVETSDIQVVTNVNVN